MIRKKSQRERDQLGSGVQPKEGVVKASRGARRSCSIADTSKPPQAMRILYLNARVCQLRESKRCSDACRATRDKIRLPAPAK
jgi:hypothetical protein